MSMKTLFLVRHAKSSRDDPTLPDRERPLNERGLHDAPDMGKRLAHRHANPDLMISSPALRALTTAQLIAQELGYEREAILVDERLYASTAENLLAVVRALDKKLQRVMLFGHNPEFTDLAHRLSSGIADLPTCAVVELHYDTKSWRDVGSITPSKVALDTPRK
jgi:phosphohistidine phosphatase